MRLISAFLAIGISAAFRAESLNTQETPPAIQRDRAGAVGAEYGVQPMSFTVHAEWINRPSVVIVDREGVVRFAYYGTFWGDRPSVHQLLKMTRSGNYFFDAPKRLKPESKP